MGVDRRYRRGLRRVANGPIALTSKKISLDLNDNLYAANREGLVPRTVRRTAKGTARIRIAGAGERSGSGIVSNHDGEVRPPG